MLLLSRPEHCRQWEFFTRLLMGCFEVREADWETKVQKQIREAGTAFLFFDYDGTLVPFAPLPRDAFPGEEVLHLLASLLISGYKVAVISGRTLEELKEILPVPGIFLVGLHGGVIQSPGGEVRFWKEKEKFTLLFQLLTKKASKFFSAFAQEGEKVFLENKGLTLAFHYRLAFPAREAFWEKEALAYFRAFAGESSLLEVIQGNKVIELRPRGMHKGEAVRQLLCESPGALPVYFGDDTTDEDAFRVLAGEGITILVSRQPRPTAARYRLADPPAVLSFCRALCKDKLPPA